MTVGVAVRCKDGVVLGTDSLATFSRGAPVARYTNKIYVINHKDLCHPVGLVGAGMTAFIDKFVDRAKRDGISVAAKEKNNQLDIVDFSDSVCETIVSILLKEYYIDKNAFFGAPLSNYSLSMIIAGATVDGELRAYHIHGEGLAESIEGYGTTGSGAAYAELFLHGFIPDPEKVTVDDAVRLTTYAVKGAEIMDPHVGGETKICTLKFNQKKLDVKVLKNSEVPQDGAKEDMEEVLRKISADMRKSVSVPSRPSKPKQTRTRGRSEQV